MLFRFYAFCILGLLSDFLLFKIRLPPLIPLQYFFCHRSELPFYSARLHRRNNCSTKQVLSTLAELGLISFLFPCFFEVPPLPSSLPKVMTGLAGVCSKHNVPLPFLAMGDCLMDTVPSCSAPSIVLLSPVWASFFINFAQIPPTFKLHFFPVNDKNSPYDGHLTTLPPFPSRFLQISVVIGVAPPQTPP